MASDPDSLQKQIEQLLGTGRKQIDPESLYQQLGQLVAAIPQDLAGPGPLSAESHRWLGRAALLVEEAGRAVGDTIDAITFSVASNGLGSVLRTQNAHEIITILHRALARAESVAPATSSGAFIPVGAAFNVFQVVGKVLSEAKTSVLAIDPYIDPTFLTDFASMAIEGVAIRILGDQFYTKTDLLRPAVGRWAKQYGDARPIEVRLASPRLLHDRVIIIDDGQIWSLTQSIKDFANRSPGMIQRVDGEAAPLKRDAYLQLWAQAQPLS